MICEATHASKVKRTRVEVCLGFVYCCSAHSKLISFFLFRYYVILGIGAHSHQDREGGPLCYWRPTDRPTCSRTRASSFIQSTSISHQNILRSDRQKTALTAQLYLRSPDFGYRGLGVQHFFLLSVVFVTVRRTVPVGLRQYVGLTL